MAIRQRKAFPHRRLVTISVASGFLRCCNSSLFGLQGGTRGSESRLHAIGLLWPLERRQRGAQDVHIR